MEIEEIPAKQLVQKVNYDSDYWFGIDYNMNLYRGCCHGCIYCDSRSDCYGIEDFDRVRVKQDAALMLSRELTGKRKKGIVGIGAMSDTYNPYEKKLQVTRQSLSIIRDLGFGVSLDTKSDLVVRDKKLLKEISDRHAAIVKLTITTANDEIARKIEPHVCVSSKRFAALKELSDAGVFAGILLMPVLPFITDTEQEVRALVQKAHENGAKFIYCGYGVTLRTGQREYFYEQLGKLNPTLVKKYQETYGNRYVCNTPWQKEYKNLLEAECQRYGILTEMKDVIAGYKGDTNAEQISLFE